MPRKAYRKILKASVIPIEPLASASHAAEHGGALPPREPKSSKRTPSVELPPTTPLPSQSTRRNPPQSTHSELMRKPSSSA